MIVKLKHMGSLIFGIFSGVIVIILAVLQYHEKLKDENAVIERQKKVECKFL